MSKTFSFENPESEEFPLEINGDSVMCVADVDGLQLLNYMAVMNNPHTQTGEKAAAMTAWFKICIKAGDYPKFQKIVEKYRLDIEQLAEVSGYLSDCYSSARPTQSADSSASGQGATGNGSEVASSETASGSKATTP